MTDVPDETEASWVRRFSGITHAQAEILMTDNSHLGKLGTVAFDLSFMLQMISLSPINPGSVETGEWMEFVPDEYQNDAYCAIHKVFEECKGTPITDEILRREVIPQLHAVSFEMMELRKEKQEGVAALVREFDAKPPPVDLNDLEEVVEQIHHYCEGGSYYLAVPLLRRLIKHHGGRK